MTPYAVFCLKKKKNVPLQGERANHDLPNQSKVGHNHVVGVHDTAEAATRLNDVVEPFEE